MKDLFDLSPKLLTFSAVAVGYLLLDDLDANEQNALGNWLMLVAQVLCTNAYFRQVQTERMQNKNFTDTDVMEMMQKMRDAIEKEIAILKKDA